MTLMMLPSDNGLVLKIKSIMTMTMTMTTTMTMTMTTKPTVNNTVSLPEQATTKEDDCNNLHPMGKAIK
jgi:hypothetical protein